MPPAEAAVAAAADCAVADRELASLFQPLAGARRVALAVSGGADSLALLDGIDRWRKAPGRPEVIVLTVDHRLRPGSDVAASAVKAIAEAREIPVRVLVRQGPPPSADIEAAARAARYRLLFEACREAGASHLVLAHHRDDVAETFLMRLKRGAGVFGLAAMRPALAVGAVTLVRPLLAVPRSRLAATTAAAGWTPVDDPMNRDPRFTRTSVRRFLAGAGLDPGLLATLAVSFAGLADAIDARATAFLGESVTTDACAIAWLDVARFAAAPAELRQRVLVRLLLAVGGGDYGPRSVRLLALHDGMLGSNGGARFKRTLAGAVVERRGGRFAVYREAGRAELPSLPVPPGYEGVWDHRFAVTVGTGVKAGLTLGPLGGAGRVQVGLTTGKFALPAGALATLPALRRGTKIVAFPSFSDGETAFRSILAERLSAPPLFPDFQAATVRSPSAKPAATAAILSC